MNKFKILNNNYFKIYNLKVGDIFSIKDLHIEYFYMKIKSNNMDYNAVDLLNGELVWIDCDEKLIKYDAEIALTKVEKE